MSTTSSEINQMDKELADLDMKVGEQTIETETRPIATRLIQLNGQVEREALLFKEILVRYQVIDLSITYEDALKDSDLINRVSNLLGTGLSNSVNLLDFGMGLVSEYDLVVNMNGKGFSSICTENAINDVPTRDKLRVNRRKLVYKLNVLCKLVIFHFKFHETPATPTVVIIILRRYLLHYFAYNCF